MTAPNQGANRRPAGQLDGRIICQRLLQPTGRFRRLSLSLVGIIGADTVIDLNAMKPALKLTLQAGHPNVGWAKKEMSGIELEVDRGNGVFVPLAFDTEPDYLDTAPLPAPGTGVVWRYRGIYRLQDERVGQWSDVASISVMG